MALNQKISKRSGHIISGINLLQVFLIQNDFLSYQRLYPSISRLAADFSDKNKSAHLFIVHSAFLVRSGTETSPSDKTALSQAFERLQSRKLQDSLMLHFSADLNIEFNPQKKPEPLSLRKTWLENIEQCDWEALKASLFSNKEY